MSINAGPPYPEPATFGDLLAVGTAADAWELAMHLISAHADPMAVCRSFADNAEQHHHEHTGSGTIRGHSPASRTFDPGKVELVLEECEANP